MMAALRPFSKTRIAPTPSGLLHLGNAYSFLLTADLARKTGAGVLLRIDDMDRERVRPDYIRDVFDTLGFLGIVWSEGPKDPEDFETRFSQHHRMASYREALDRLRATGRVYACGCSRSLILLQGGHDPDTCRSKRLSLDAEGVAWRLDTDGSDGIAVNAVDGTVVHDRLTSDSAHFIVRKRDGFPAYQLTSLVDDLRFGVDLIVRGQDLWQSTLSQLYLAAVLGEGAFGEVCFHHHTLIADADGRKLSKSEGDTSIRALRAKGLSSEEIIRIVLTGS